MVFPVSPAAVRLRRLQRAVEAFVPGSPPVPRYPSREAMNDPAEVERRERESREYNDRYARYEVLRDGLLESISTLKASFPDAPDLTEFIRTLLIDPAWPTVAPADPEPCPRASQPFTCAITRNAPPALLIPAISGATG